MTQVVAGILRRGNTILIGQRRSDQSHPGKWEFPGGKIEAAELPEQALVRELREELGIEATAAAEVMRYEFAYPGKEPILLIFFEVTHWSGEVENRIFENLIWEPRQTLAGRDFLAGDEPILSALR